MRSGLPPVLVIDRTAGRVLRLGLERLGVGDLAALKGTVYLSVRTCRPTELHPAAAKLRRYIKACRSSVNESITMAKAQYRFAAVGSCFRTVGNVRTGGPNRTNLSTNATCQLENSENSADISPNFTPSALPRARCSSITESIEDT